MQTVLIREFFIIIVSIIINSLILKFLIYKYYLFDDNLPTTHDVEAFSKVSRGRVGEGRRLARSFVFEGGELTAREVVDGGVADTGCRRDDFSHARRLGGE